jgi:hypothetical protein
MSAVEHSGRAGAEPDSVVLDPLRKLVGLVYQIIAELKIAP